MPRIYFISVIQTQKSLPKLERLFFELQANTIKGKERIIAFLEKEK